MKKSILVALAIMALLTSCKRISDIDYEDVLVQYIVESFQCQVDIMLIEDNMEWQHQEEYAERYDSLMHAKSHIDSLYDKLTPPNDSYAETYEHIKNAQRCLNNLVSNLEMLKMMGTEHFDRNSYHESIMTLNSEWGEIRLTSPKVFERVKEYNENKAPSKP